MRKSSLWSRSWTLPVIATLLLCVTVASRIPFVSHLLYGGESVNFALALKSYDIRLQQPHPPGYPLYVGIGKLVDLWVHDANASFVFISIAASAAAVAILFLLASRMYDPWTGITAAVLLGASTGFWGYGEVADSHTSLALFGALVAWLCYLLWLGHRSAAVLCGLVLGIAIGVRQDMLIYLGPLWLVSIWRAGVVRFLLSTLVLCLTVASWLLPVAQLSGGWAAFQQASIAEISYVISTYSAFSRGFSGVGNNTGALLLFLQQMLGLGTLVVVYFLGRFVTFKALVADHRLRFLLLWFLPPAIVYMVVHIGDPGQVLSLLPALCIVVAVGIRDIAHDLRSATLLLSGQHRRLARLAGLAGGAGTVLAFLMVVGLVAWNLNAFIRTPGPARLTEIRAVDATLAGQSEFARRFQPGSVVVLAQAQYRQIKYYLPEYDVRLLYDEHQPGYADARQSYEVPQGVSTALVMEFGEQPDRFPGVSGQEITLTKSPAVSLWQFDVKPGDTIEYGYNYFTVRSSQPSAVGNQPG